ncbi:MAG: hypothetical protein WBZ51_33445, partial [Xanthobacteraceae bacterium]
PKAAGNRPCRAKAIGESVRALLDLQGRGQPFFAARSVQGADTRAGGFVLTRKEAAGKWGVDTYSLVHT